MDIFARVKYYGFGVSTFSATSTHLGCRVHDRVGSFGSGWSRCRFSNVLDRKCFQGVTHKIKFCLVFQVHTAFVTLVSSFFRLVFSFPGRYTTSRTCTTWTPLSPGNGVGPRLMRLGSCGPRSCRSFSVRYNVENSVANDGRRRVFRTESMCAVWSLVCFCQANSILDLNDADIFVFLPLHLEHDKARRSKGSCSVGALFPCDRMRTLVFVCVCDSEQ